MRACVILVLTLATGAVWAGPYDQPYALVESGDTSEVRKESALAITDIDGSRVHNPRRSDALPPGKHRITLHYATARGQFRPEYQVIEMDLEACTRYRVVASYEVRTGPEWKPKVYAEPIGECARKFQAKPAAPK